MATKKSYQPPEAGEILESIMESRGMSQADLARATGRQRSVINDAITGRRNIGLRLGKDLAKALDLPEEEFFKRLGVFRGTSNNPLITELIGIAEALPPSELEEVILYMRFRKSTSKKNDKGGKNKKR